MGGQDAQLEREDQQGNGNGEEDVHGLPHQGEGDHGAVPPTALLQGGEKAGRDAEGDGNQQRGKVELGGYPDFALQQVGDVAASVLVAFAEVAAQGVADVPGVLDSDGVVQSLLLSDSLVGILPEVLSQEDLYRIARAEASQGKSDEGYDKEQNRNPEQPAAMYVATATPSLRAY